MSVARTAIRRRKQFANGLKHLAKLGRPKYKTGTTDEARRKREERWRANRAKGL